MRTYLSASVAVGLIAWTTGTAEAQTAEGDFGILQACIAVAMDVKFVGSALYNGEFGDGHRVATDLQSDLETNYAIVEASGDSTLRAFFDQDDRQWQVVMGSLPSCLNGNGCLGSAWGAEMMLMSPEILAACQSAYLGN